jgi:hypothetical protein
MPCDHKKPGLAFWATVVVVVLLAAYPLSIGPVSRFASRIDAVGDPHPAHPVMFVYVPLGKLILHRCSAGHSRLIIWWITTCLPRGHTVMVPTLVEGQDRIAIENR